MNPTPATVQGGMVMALATGVLPHLSVPYALGTAAAAAALLAFMAQDTDRGAERRVSEINGMQAIFAEFCEVAVGADQGLRDEAYSRSRDIFISFELSELDERRREHLPVLIQIHELVESIEQAWARKIELQILAHLRTTAEGRALVIPVMG
jgi:hypothetical protein